MRSQLWRPFRSALRSAATNRAPSTLSPRSENQQWGVQLKPPAPASRSVKIGGFRGKMKGGPLKSRISMFNPFEKNIFNLSSKNPRRGVCETTSITMRSLKFQRAVFRYNSEAGGERSQPARRAPAAAVRTLSIRRYVDLGRPRNLQTAQGPAQKKVSWRMVGVFHCCGSPWV